MTTTWPDWYTDERVVILLADHTTILIMLTAATPEKVTATLAESLTTCLYVLGSVDAMLRFIHAIGSLKLAVLVPVHACIQQIILVFVCGMYPLYSRYRGIRTTSRQISFEFLFIKTRPTDKLHTRFRRGIE